MYRIETCGFCDAPLQTDVITERWRQADADRIERPYPWQMLVIDSRGGTR